MHSTLYINKLQTPFYKVKGQLEIEKSENKASKRRIEELQKKVIELGKNPNNPKPRQQLIK